MLAHNLSFVSRMYTKVHYSEQRTILFFRILLKAGLCHSSCKDA